MFSEMNEEKKYKLGLVLSGGGYRGAAQIGVIKAMEENAIEADIVAGVSAGALVGSMYACGVKHDKILDFFKNAKLFQLSHYTYGKPGLLDSEKFIEYISTYLPQCHYEDLKRPLFVAATDMLSGRLTVFSTGELNKKILASCAFPFIFSPVEIDGSYYSDGGIINNFPVETIRDKCERLIGVFVNPVKTIKKEELSSSLKVLERAFTISTSIVHQGKFNMCDFVIEPESLHEYNIFDRKNIDKIFQEGYESALPVIEKLKMKLNT
jgi:NTE family protein